MNICFAIWFTKGVLFFQIRCAIIRIAKIRRGLGVKTSGPFFVAGRGFILSPVCT